MCWGNTEVEEKVAVLKCCRGFGGLFHFFLNLRLNFFKFYGWMSELPCAYFWECCSYNLFDSLGMGNSWLSGCFAAGALLDVYLYNSILLSSQNVVPSLHQLQWFYSSSCVLRLSYFSSSPQLCLGPKYTPSALMKRWVSHTLSFTLSLTICRSSDRLQDFASCAMYPLRRDPM